jgi:hypothetical protein
MNRLWMGVFVVSMLTVAGLILFSVGLGSQRAGPRVTTKMQARVLARGAVDYFARHGSLFVDMKDFDHDWLQSGDEDVWIDGWGRKMKLDIRPDLCSLVIISAGEDGLVGTPDDICVTQPLRRSAGNVLTSPPTTNGLTP